jgi:predicted permease
MGLLSVGAAMRIEKTGAPLAAHAWWLAVKLVAVPLIAWIMIRTIGFGHLEEAILMICASIPTASGAYILAVRMTGDGRDVATQITVGTVLSMATIPLWIGLVGA